MNSRPVFGAGSAGRPAGGLAAHLAGLWIDEVADVRSAVPDRALRDRLSAAGIGYTHLPALCDSADNRGLTGSDSQLRRGIAHWRYDKEVLDSEPGQHAFAGLLDAAVIRRVCVLGASEDGERCHRRYLLDRLESVYGFAPAELECVTVP